MKYVKSRTFITICCTCLICLFGTFPVFASSSGEVIKSTPEDEVLTSEEVTVLRISSTDTSGFHSVILGLIGDYNPIVKDYTYTSTQGYISHSIDIQPDWSWIASCAVFAIVFFCFMQFLGKIFTR